MIPRHHFALVLLILTVAGCGALSPVAEKPTATVRSVSLSSASFTGMDGKISMDIFNPNGFALPLTQVEWTLTVGSSQAVRGSFDLTATIPAKGSAPVQGTLHIGAASAVGVAAAVAQGIRTYQVRATLHFKTRFGPITAAVVHDGELI